MKHPDVVNLDQLSNYSTVIDVRSPAEFEEDHIPGAISCPVLSNEERIRVGTLYKQVSPFEANKVGAALVARNIAMHLEQLFAGHGRDWKPLIYCWRGGNRSGAMAHILRQVGWGAAQLRGGYKSHRTAVVQGLATRPVEFDYRVVCGETGSAKSRLLEEIRVLGGQVLDLEALACHKGSVLGILPDQPQPSQKMFETRVLHQLQGFDPAKPVFVEAESKKIGVLRVPEALFDTMSSHGKVIQLVAPVPARVEFLMRDYDYFLQDPEGLKMQLDFLHKLHGHGVIHRWKDQIDAGDWPGLVTELLVNHYDPAYRRSTPFNLQGLEQAQVIELARLHDADLKQAAAHVMVTAAAVQSTR